MKFIKLSMFASALAVIVAGNVTAMERSGESSLEMFNRGINNVAEKVKSLKREVSRAALLFEVLDSMIDTSRGVFGVSIPSGSEKLLEVSVQGRGSLDTLKRVLSDFNLVLRSKIEVDQKKDTELTIYLNKEGVGKLQKKLEALVGVITQFVGEFIKSESDWIESLPECISQETGRFAINVFQLLRRAEAL